MNALEYRQHLLEAAQAAQAPAPVSTPPESPDIALYRQLLKSGLQRGKQLPGFHSTLSDRQERLMSGYMEDLRHAADWLRSAASFALARGGKAGQSLMVEFRHHKALLDDIRDGFSVETAPARAAAWNTCFLHLLDGLERCRWVAYRPSRRKE
ncbi:hypothetical protein [Acidithiobacillus ferrivorans]|uniref:hypothetical protein n=1 Tax=Acidithiobacillus ferrivorans TaxID=160808 RepID=UPI001C0788B5|nr:hypothetical protein [Acidithiobacillus ferrivorans]MBU2851468.1 hypothetical protein [Acidithiobacillus ferrivorans]